MRDRQRYQFVNWKDGMKINKDHFIDQNNAVKDAMADIAALNLSPYRYGILPPTLAGETNFSAKISLDNTGAIQVVVDACQAITPGGVRIALPAFGSSVAASESERPSFTLPFSPLTDELEWYLLLVVNPFVTQPAGPLDPYADPPRHQYVIPTYSFELLSATQMKQFAQYPYALAVGKLFVSNGEVNVEDYFIPPCYAVHAHPELVSLLGEVDGFLAALERHCSKTVQKIFQKSQQGRIVELVQFLCDRVILYLGQALSAARWTLLYDSPSALFYTLASLARVIRNTIDLRIGSGKDELMGYMGNWCDLNPGELESMLSSIANMKYDHNDVNKNISEAAVFVKVMNKLFGTLSQLDMIDKKKEKERPIVFVKEEAIDEAPVGGSKLKRFG
ncbi:Type VI secretion, VC_A0110, EvfL, ImpJ, VasE [Cnuella takakiae]|uniref:Type VI secretion, VC_A0110, EvfL, ImpJ, VasE n=1 Tax=Cnuella takakiae TaxID=1302690 RepID=A0A1M4S9B4_9BACT|nr:type VI secretion system baseplate subunit TssK [Cnuella takakiae]OLY94429.1 hypothetical protein BUE76_23010 [Cnuella takakiae]SHE28794.1 Type VI secretion, VC_A0110, EvfL, ImpJ, VasE [Cnuella takakiae]